MSISVFIVLSHWKLAYAFLRYELFLFFYESSVFSGQQQKSWQNNLVYDHFDLNIYGLLPDFDVVLKECL